MRNSIVRESQGANVVAAKADLGVDGPTNKMLVSEKMTTTIADDTQFWEAHRIPATASPPT